MDVVTIQRALRDLIADGLGAESERGLRVQLHGVTVEAGQNGARGAGAAGQAHRGLTAQVF